MTDFERSSVGSQSPATAPAGPAASSQAPQVPLEGPSNPSTKWFIPYLRIAAIACVTAWGVLIVQSLWWPNLTVSWLALIVAAGWPAGVEHVRARGTPDQRAKWSKSGGVVGTLLKIVVYLPTLAITLGLFSSAYSKAHPAPPEPGTPEYADVLKRSAAGGDATAAAELSELYRYGRGVEKSPSEAVRWLRVAAEAGVKESQYNLGLFLARGDGIAKDSRAAVEWFQKAADQGVPDAMYQLGIAYANGEGVDKDRGKAAEWCRRAADAGNGFAKQLLKEPEPK